MRITGLLHYCLFRQAAIRQTAEETRSYAASNLLLEPRQPDPDMFSRELLSKQQESSS